MSSTRIHITPLVRVDFTVTSSNSKIRELSSSTARITIAQIKRVVPAICRKKRHTDVVEDDQLSQLVSRSNGPRQNAAPVGDAVHSGLNNDELATAVA